VGSCRGSDRLGASGGSQHEHRQRWCPRASGRLERLRGTGDARRRVVGIVQVRAAGLDVGRGIMSVPRFCAAGNDEGQLGNRGEYADTATDPDAPP
jgi:hypothetical protein